MSNEPMAFPASSYEAYNRKVDGEDEAGMTLEDWFAGMALQGLLARLGPDEETSPRIGLIAYHVASQMMHARGGG